MSMTKNILGEYPAGEISVLLSHPLQMKAPERKHCGFVLIFIYMK